MPDCLPDSRLRDLRGSIRGAAGPIGSTNWRPIFCANCGAPGGHVPEASCTFAFYLCDACHARHGAAAGTLAVPDALFWARVAETALETYGRPCTPAERTEAAAAAHGALAALLREAPRGA